MDFIFKVFLKTARVTIAPDAHVSQLGLHPKDLPVTSHQASSMNLVKMEST